MLYRRLRHLQNSQKSKVQAQTPSFSLTFMYMANMTDHSLRRKNVGFLTKKFVGVSGF